GVERMTTGDDRQDPLTDLAGSLAPSLCFSHKDCLSVLRRTAHVGHEEGPCATQQQAREGIRRIVDAEVDARPGDAERKQKGAEADPREFARQWRAVQREGQREPERARLRCVAGWEARARYRLQVLDRRARTRREQL